MEEVITPRKPLEIFAQRCEIRLQENDSRKGERGWLEGTPGQLYECLQKQVAQLGRSLIDGKGIGLEGIQRQCADVGNLAMMINDKMDH